MITRRKLFCGAAVSALMLTAATAADAQSGVVIMRKAIKTYKAADNPASAPTPSPTTPAAPVGYYSWTTSGWKQTGTCGSKGLETRTISCVTTDGDTVADSFCMGNNSGTKPDASRPVTITATCGYSWSPGSWSVSPTTCGTYTETRSISCVRSDGTVVKAEDCKAVGSVPDSKRTITETSSCSYAWSASSWSAPSSSCGDGTQTRSVECQRSDGTTADAALCVGEKPATSQAVHSTASCTASWNAGDFGSPAPACGTTIATRSVTCQRADGVQVGDDQCDGAKPASSKPAEDYSTCTDGRTSDHPYGWMLGDFGGPSTSCGTATHTRTVTCTDNSGKPVSDALCVQTKPSTTLTTSEMSGCGYAWHAGEFSAAQPACGTTVQSRTVSCVRSDGQVASASNCTGDQPSSTRSSTDYSACTFGWASGSWSPISTTCGDAVQTRDVYCQRVDGTVETDQTKCVGEKPPETQTSHQTAGCSFGWTTGSYGPAESACGASTQTRSVTCVRGDGVTVEDAQCGGTKPDATQPATSYSACTFAWTIGDYSDPSTTCGTSTQTRSVTCQRSDGTVAANEGSCATTKPSTTQTTSQISGCSYAWTASGFGSPVPACGSTVRSRSYSCVRSDGVTVAGTNCSGPAPTDTSEAATDYSTCSYSWDVSLWQGSAACGISVQQNRSVRCRRSDGSTVSDAQCGASGTKPASTQTISDYSACSYAWNVTYGAWSSTCSANATRTNEVTCNRSDGTTVGDDYCTTTKPSTTDTKDISSSCTYIPTYSDTYGTCKSKTYGGTAGTQTAPIVSCKRSDGVTAALSSCSPQTKTQDCVVPNTSDRYAREAAVLVEPNTVAQSPYTVYYQNPTPNASVLKLAVTSTLCWDSTTNTTTTSTNCASLAAGPNIYDSVALPATFVTGLREVYLNQADIAAAIPHADNVLAMSKAAVCTNGPYVTIGTSGATQSYTVRCGTPDTADHYVRAPYTLADPYYTQASPNIGSSGSSVKFKVASTLCYDTALNKVTANGKCSYLPTGANVNDLVAVPATYVPDLRELYVSVADFAAASPYSFNFIQPNGSSATAFNIGCAQTGGLQFVIVNSGSSQTWTIRCGTPDTPDHYVRAPNLADPYYGQSSATAYKNVDFAASVFNMRVYSTLCYDTKAKGTTSLAAKCSYLPSGANVSDIVPIPATFVRDLREIYVSTADFAAISPYSNVFIDAVGASGVPFNTACASAAGISVIIGASGGQQSWALRCGTPDTATHYARYAANIVDVTTPNGGSASTNTNLNTASTYVANVYSTYCWDTTTNAQATRAAKCNYLPTGPQGGSPGTKLTFNVTYVNDLAEIYFNQDEINAAMPRGGTFLGMPAASCPLSDSKLNYYTVVGGKNYRILCGKPDYNHYTRYASYFNDPYLYGPSTYFAYLNRSSYNYVILNVGAYGCIDNNTGAEAPFARKCENLTTGGNTGDRIKIPAVMSGRNAIILKSDVIAATSPYFSAGAMLSLCGNASSLTSGLPLISVDPTIYVTCK